MCYSCGCGKLSDDMGDPKNITDKTFEEAAKASKQSPSGSTLFRIVDFNTETGRSAHSARIRAAAPDTWGSCKHLAFSV